MNLQENIERIQSMMGVINEDRKDDFIKNMINDIGIEKTFKMVGDYDLMESYFTDEDKINYIKDQFHKINDGNYFNLDQIGQKTIRIKEEDNEIQQIEGLHKYNVTIIKYNRNSGGINKYYPKYEELSSEAIDKLFRMMLSQYI
jgi:hypothetical protein